MDKIKFRIYFVESGRHPLFESFRNILLFAITIRLTRHCETCYATFVPILGVSHFSCYSAAGWKCLPPSQPHGAMLNQSHRGMLVTLDALATFDRHPTLHDDHQVWNRVISVAVADRPHARRCGNWSATFCRYWKMTKCWPCAFDDDDARQCCL